MIDDNDYSQDITLDDVPCATPGERKDIVCPDCQSCTLILKNSKFGHFYGCPNFETTGCKGTVSADQFGYPRGTPAPAKTRSLRKQAMDLLERRKQKTGQGTYLFLKKLLGKDTNIGRLDEAESLRVVQALRHEFGEYNLWDRLREEDD